MAVKGTGWSILDVGFPPNLVRIACRFTIFDPYGAMQQIHSNSPRIDQETVDCLVKEKVDYFDMNEVHIQDFKKYAISWDDYQKEYLIGHYSPRGNHFFAYSIKDTIVNWLQPKPMTYRNPDADTTGFKGYLQGYH
jgi:hypothetical protein